MTKILLVEDDKSLREIYGVRLLAEGYDIVSAGDGEEALAMAIKEKPTLIISDVMMPKISGFDMLDILRSTTETRDIKVIMMTALSSEDQRARGEQLGADRYLVKSQVGIEDVVRTVHEVLADTAGIAGVPAAAAAPAADAPAAPAVDAPAPVPPVTPPADDVAPATDASADSDSSAVSAADEPPVTTSAPGNDTAGPLPPQPNEIGSALPQPTAPFSSPRPSNLGEQVVHPEETPEPVVSSEVSDQIAKELQASAEPVANSQVDDAISDKDVEPVEHAVDAPVESTPTSPVTGLPSVPPTPDDEPKPEISGTSTPIS